MTSFAPTLIAPAPCRPIPLVRNRHHQHHTSRYARLSISSTSSSSRRSSGGSHHKHSQSGSIGSDAAFCFTSATSSPPVSTPALPQSALSSLLTPLQEVQRHDSNAPTTTPKLDHDRTPTRKNMQAYSANLSAQPSNPASPPSSALTSPFLEVPPSSTLSANNNNNHTSHTPSSNTLPTLIPPSPIPRRLTRNPFVRSLSQQHTVTLQLGLGLGLDADSHQDPATPTQHHHANADPFLLRPSLSDSEPAHRFSMDNLGIGLMEIDFDLDNFSADDGGRELLRVERERRKRSFEMHA